MENTINNLITLAEEHGNMILVGDSKKANKIHKELTKVLACYDNNNKDLFPLLKNENESVRLWVSSYLLKNGNLNGKRTLEELSNSKTIFSTSAEILLDLFHKGLLK
jgi:hypothetical protein